MPSKIPSLGEDRPSDLRLKTESRELPPSRKELLNEVEAILGLGKVQKISIEIGRPIVFSRLVEKSMEDPSEEVSEDPFEVMANNEIEEYSPDHDYDVGELLLRAFAIITQKGMQPESFFVSNLSTLRKSLGVERDWHVDRLFGLPVLRSDHVPDGVLLLTGARDEKKYSLRMLLPERKS